VRWLAGCSPRGCEAGENSAAALPQCTHGPDPLGSGWLCGRHFFLGPLPSSLSPLLQVHRVFLYAQQLSPSPHSPLKCIKEKGGAPSLQYGC
jgi:hypothetical protein